MSWKDIIKGDEYSRELGWPSDIDERIRRLSQYVDYVIFEGLNGELEVDLDQAERAKDYLDEYPSGDIREFLEKVIAETKYGTITRETIPMAEELGIEVREKEWD
jgi:hypothetical protein